MIKEPQVIVIESGGFCTTKNEKDVLESDQIVCKVKDSDEGENIIHGRSKKKEDYEKVEKI